MVPRRVLVVDDYPDMALTIAEQLCDCGYDGLALDGDGVPPKPAGALAPR